MTDRTATSVTAINATTFDSADDAPTVVLRPRTRSLFPDFAELWRFRDLLRCLVARDVLVRYKQTVLGAAWAVIQPLVTMVVLHLLFGRMLGIAQHVQDTPYPVFLFTGLLPWAFFAATVTAASTSLVKHAGILTKVYFPRLLLPAAAAGGPLVDLLVSFLVLLGLMAWFTVLPTASLLLLPLVILTALLAALSVGVLLAAVTVWYRDVQHAVPFLVQIWFFLTPVIYPTQIIPERFRDLTMLNPMVGVIEAFRAVALGTPINTTAWFTAVAVSGVMLLVALVLFQRVERRFADVI